MNISDLLSKAEYIFACEDLWLDTQGGAAITQLAAISFHVGELLSGNWLMPLPGQLSLLLVNYQGTGGVNEVKN